MRLAGLAAPHPVGDAKRSESMKLSILALAACTPSLLLAFASLAAAENPTVPLDLSAAGLKATIQAPAGALGSDEFGISVAVRKPPHFAISLEAVDDGPKHIASSRKFAVENDQQKLKAFHVESPDTLLFEASFLGNKLFHFVTTVKVGGKTYACEDKKDADNNYTRADVDAMLAACRSLKAK
jgi:hypothetical protein